MSTLELVPKALPPGSPLWWGLLFTEPERRPAVRALMAVRGELLETANRVSDPAVASARLGWWREEARRFGSGGEQHPATRALAASPGGEAVEPEYLEELVDGAEMDALHRPYGGFSELRLYCHRSSGVLHELVATVSGTRARGAERTARRAAHRIGIGVRLAGIACGFGADLRAGRLYLPGDWLEEAGVDDAALAEETPGPAVQGCLSRIGREARRELCEGLARFPADELDRHRSAAVVSALAGRALDAAEARRWAPPPAPRRGFAAAADSLGDLTTAWRAARHAAKTARNTP